MPVLFVAQCKRNICRIMHDAWGNVTMEHMDSKVKSETTPENDVVWDNQARPTIRKESICIVLLLHIGPNFISNTGKQTQQLFFWKITFSTLEYHHTPTRPTFNPRRVLFSEHPSTPMTLCSSRFCRVFFLLSPSIASLPTPTGTRSPWPTVMSASPSTSSTTPTRLK